jgi:hypothetical protein
MGHLKPLTNLTTCLCSSYPAYLCSGDFPQDYHRGQGLARRSIQDAQGDQSQVQASYEGYGLQVGTCYFKKKFPVFDAHKR